MKVLILNRRDIKNPAGGGAEVYTHEVAKGFLRHGYGVDIFSSRFTGGAEKEQIDGIPYIRKGNELTVHFRGFAYALRHRKEYALMIDEFNGMGFFGFLLPKSAILIHQMYREFWLKELGRAGYLPYFIEPLLLKLYRGMPAVTVSNSTKEDLESLGFEDVKIIMNALYTEPLPQVPEKEKEPTIIFLGRLRSTKRPEDAIEIFRIIKKALPSARLWIAGKGPDEGKLRQMASGLDGITFFGFVTDEKKLELLARAHVLVVPSVREGFGINVIEAAGRGTPAVGYNVHGLRDSIKDGVTGYLADGPEDAAKKILDLFGNEKLYHQLASNCLEYAKGFNWERRADEFVNWGEGILNQRNDWGKADA